MTQQSIATLFRIPAGNAMVDVRPTDPAVSEAAYPTLNNNYVFPKTLLKKLLLFLTSISARSNLLLVGDTGAGKSSLVEQVAARLNIPVFAVACSGRMRLANLVGGFTLSGGNTIWNDGPLLLAMRHGGIFLADEVTRLDQGEQMSLAHVLDVGVLTVPETGEVVRAAEGFRFIATGNSAGHGDESGAYSGERVASAAFLNRFQKLHVDYLDPASEERLLQMCAPNLDADSTQRMVHFAKTARENFVSRGGNLRTAVSTRDIVVWALETVRYAAFQISAKPLDEALDDTILNGACSEDAAVLRELWNNWNQ